MPASLTPLKPPALIATEEEAGVELVALEAGRSPQGLMATWQAKNKHVDAYQTIALGDPQQREALVCKVYPNPRGRNARRFARILLGAGQKVEAALRDQTQKRGDETQAARIVQLAQAWDLFHTPDGVAYVTFPGEGGEQQTWPLRCRVTRDRLEQVYFTTHNGVPGAPAVQDALG